MRTCYTSEWTIRQNKHPVLLHRLEDDSQKFLPRRYILQNDSIPQLLTLVQHVTHRKRVQCPHTCTVSLQSIRVLDVIFIRRSITLDIHVKHLLYGLTIIHKRPSSHRLAVRIFAPLPQPVYLSAGKPSVALQRIDQPYIPIEKFFRHNTKPLFYISKNNIYPAISPIT